ncbi:hypothetical protein [Caballeronia sp.]|uniref:hypothetical protein n=1 Tax=Caballeronia sp. TaxID=1931223 RepID=UPI003C5BC438
MTDFDAFRAKRGRTRGFIDNWNPRVKTLELLYLMLTIENEYAAHLPLIRRHIFYRLVSKHGYARSEKSYAALGQHLSNARRVRFIDFNVIRDDGFPRSGALGYPDIAASLRVGASRAARFTRDRQLTHAMCCDCPALRGVSRDERTRA